MPRVNGIYSLPPNSYGTPGATIESSKFNGVIDDFAAEANGIRPVGAGGTGVGSIAEFKIALNYKIGDFAGGQLSSFLTSAVKAHGTLGAVTEEYKYADANTHSVTVAASSGTHSFNLTGLVEGGTMRTHITWQSGALAFPGIDEWVQGNGERATSFGTLGVTLVAGRTYLLTALRAGTKTIGSWA